MYASLFSIETNRRNIHGKHFRVTLTKRATVLMPSSSPKNNFLGANEIFLNANSKAQYVVSLRFEEPSTEFDRAINNSTFGWWSLDHQYPSIDLTIRNSNNLARHVSRLFIELASLGKPGVECSWSMRVTPIIGLSADQVWGDWNAPSEFGPDGSIKKRDLPGLRSFEIESLEFHADV